MASTMLPARRRARVIEILRREKIVSLKDLAAEIPVSLSSVRRDVDYLEETGFLERTHGGVVLKSDQITRIEPEPDLASAIESDAKESIARRAAQIIEPGQSVIFDSGSTTLAAARAAVEQGISFLAFTNDIRIAATLSASPHIGVEVSGGRIRPRSATLIGPGATRSFMRLKVDLSFLGAHAIDDECFSDSTLELADLKAEIVRSAKCSVLLADHTKFGQRSLYSIGKVNQLDRIITDQPLDEAVFAHYRSLGIAIDETSR